MRNLILVFITFLVVIGASIFLAIQLVQFSKTALLHTYSDPDGYFTISLPLSWNIGQQKGIGTTNIGTIYEKSQTVEAVDLSSQNMGITIKVIETTPACADSIPMHKYTTTTLGGMPALYDPTSFDWFVKTQKASYIITARYPGSKGTDTGSIVPAPQFIKNQDRELMTEIIASFHPRNANTFPCY